LILLIWPVIELFTMFFIVPGYEQYPVLRALYGCSRFFLEPLGSTVYMFEVYLTVLIALQRCIALAAPLKFNKFNTNVLKPLLVGIGVFSVGFNIPHWIALAPNTYWNKQLNMTLLMSGATDFQFSKYIWYMWYKLTLVPIFESVIPVVFLVVCNIVLIVARRRMTRMEHSGQVRDRQGAAQLTAIVTAITLMSVAVHALNTVYYMDTMLLILPRNISQSMIYARSLMRCLNSSTNFVFYCAFGRQFRLALRNMFKRNNPD